MRRAALLALWLVLSAFPASAEQNYILSDYSKQTEDMEELTELETTITVTSSTSNYFVLASLRIHSFALQVSQVTVIIRTDGEADVSDTLDVMPGVPVRTIQLPAFFQGLDLGSRTFEVLVNQDTTGPLVYQTESYLLVSDVGANVQSIKEIYWSPAIMGADETYCGRPLLQPIGISAPAWQITCGDNNSAYISGNIRMPRNYRGGNLILEIQAISENATPVGDLVFGCQAQCVGDGVVLNPAFSGETENLTLTFDTQYEEYHAVTAALTPSGTCNSGVSMYWYCAVNASLTTLDGTEMSETRIMGLSLRY